MFASSTKKEGKGGTARLENSRILTATCERKLASQFSLWKLTAPLNGRRNGRATFGISKIGAHRFLGRKKKTKTATICTGKRPRDESEETTG